MTNDECSYMATLIAMARKTERRLLGDAIGAVFLRYINNGDVRDALNDLLTELGVPSAAECHAINANQE